LGVTETARATDLLQWYDLHARDLPWRVPPRANHSADPYRVWLSEVMLQQTTVAAVRSYFERFTTLWPDVAALAAAPDDQVMAEWAGLGYYARARNLLKCARVVAHDLGGDFPGDLAGLRALPGIGPYTAAAIAAIAFDQHAVVVDGNVERVMARLHAVTNPLPGAKAELTDFAKALTPDERPGDYAQAVMDLGATICTPRNPTCGICPWSAPCQARAQGIAADLPKKTPKKPKPTRFGIAYIGRGANGDWVVERRPDKGLLGGMLGWPGSEWRVVAADDHIPDNPPLPGDWRDPGGEARHTFTHFHLRLGLRVALLSDDQIAALPTPGGPGDTGPGDSGAACLLRLPADQFSPSDMPTVMRKAFDLAQGALDEGAFDQNDLN
jgi:A/G-specific adenine glycosylase